MDLFIFTPPVFIIFYERIISYYFPYFSYVVKTRALDVKTCALIKHLSYYLKTAVRAVLFPLRRQLSQKALNLL